MSLCPVVAVAVSRTRKPPSVAKVCWNVAPVPVATTVVPPGSTSTSHSREPMLPFCTVEASVNVTTAPCCTVVCDGLAVKAAVTTTPPLASVTVMVMISLSDSPPEAVTTSSTV